MTGPSHPAHNERLTLFYAARRRCFPRRTGMAMDNTYLFQEKLLNKDEGEF